MSPPLFVLGMEYFSKVMRYVGKQQDFTFHPRCKSLAINHFYFVDDVAYYFAKVISKLCICYFRVLSFLQPLLG